MVVVVRALSEQLPAQILPRIVSSRCYSFFRSAFDNSASDGRKKFRWDAEEEFAGLDHALLHLWIDVIVAHYTTAYLRDTPACAPFYADLLAATSGAAALAKTPTPPSRALTTELPASAAHEGIANQSPPAAARQLTASPHAPLIYFGQDNSNTSGSPRRRQSQQQLPRQHMWEAADAAAERDYQAELTRNLQYELSAQISVLRQQMQQLGDCRSQEARFDPAAVAAARREEDPAMCPWMFGAGGSGTSVRLQDILN